MDIEVDHYSVLGLPSGEEGSKLTEQEISKAYKLKALELHPDKRRDDPNAPADFQKLMASYDILKDEKARKLFDDLLRAKRERQRRLNQSDSKRRRMVSDLERREREAFSEDAAVRARDEEEQIARKLKEEIAKIRAMHSSKAASAASAPKKEKGEVGRESEGNVGFDKEKVLKVSWDTAGEGYSVEKLRKIFEEFGEVEDIILRSSKKKNLALVVMASKEAVVATTKSACGDFTNPLLVKPLLATVAKETDSSNFSKYEEPSFLSNLVGAGYRSFEDSVLMKLQKAAERQKQT